MLHYDFLDLRLFVRAVDVGGIAAAAKQSNISVSAVSERIKLLEQRVGMQLLQRSTRGSLPTAAGLEFATHARSILLQSERLNGAITTWKGRGKAVLRLRANSNSIASFLPDLLASFLARHPGVVVDLEEDTSDEIARAVRGGDVDAGIAASNADLEGLELRPFRTDHLVLLVPVAHPFASRSQIAFSETLDEQFIGLDDHASIQKYIGAHANRLGRELRVRLRLRSFEGVCRMVSAGVGLAVVPKSVIPIKGRETNARVVALTDQWARRELVICLRTERPVSPLLDSLLNEIESHGRVWMADTKRPRLDRQPALGAQFDADSEVPLTRDEVLPPRSKGTAK